MNTDEEYMSKCIELAKRAAKSGECPVGAVVVDKNGMIIGTGYNMREMSCSPTAHAEIIAIEEAARYLKTWRLSDCTIYVTLEPCPMCAGAISNARLRRLVYGAFDENGGACSSSFNLYDFPIGHKPLVRSRVLIDECSALLSEFFSSLRDKDK